MLHISISFPVLSLTREIDSAGDAVNRPLTFIGHASLLLHLLKSAAFAGPSVTKLNFTRGGNTHTASTCALSGTPASNVIVIGLKV